MGYVFRKMRLKFDTQSVSVKHTWNEFIARNVNVVLKS